MLVYGDTVDVELDLGFHLKITLRCRLLYINTPERGEEGWAKSTAALTDILKQHQEFTFKTHKSDSFGRWLVEIWTIEEYPVSINQWMLINKYAKEFRK